MREELGGVATEGRRAGFAGLDAFGSVLGMVEAMHLADGESLEAVRGALPAVARVVALAVERMRPAADGAVVGGAGGRGGGRLVYCGAGTSGRLGVLDASECVPTFGVPAGMVVGLIAGGDRALREAVEGAEDDFQAGEAAVRGVGGAGAGAKGRGEAGREGATARVRDPGGRQSGVEGPYKAGRQGGVAAGAGVLLDGVGARDVVVGIAASGRTPWVLGAMAEARARGALTVGVSCVPGSAVEGAGELSVTMATGAEVVAGSTRLKAGTATKLVLNMISTGVMVRLGYVYGDLMVNVQPTNAKLRARAARIVGELCGLESLEAEGLLAGADGEVKTAVVMGRLGVGAEEARARLANVGGVLGRALEPNGVRAG